MEALGLGNQALRRIPIDRALRMDVDALRAAIAKDRTDGLAPCCVIATAGSVNTGAIDDLPALAALASDEDLWLHVDGCIGALIAIAPRNAYRVAGIEMADSLALDPHKWLHAPFEAVARWSGTRRLIAPRSPLRPNIFSRRRAASHPENGCTNGACKPRADSGHSRSGWRLRSTASKSLDV